MTTPIYRGTYAELEANKQTAINWMIDQCNEAAKSLDDEKRKLIRVTLEKHRAGENLGDAYGLLNVMVRRPSSYVSIFSTKEKEDYFYKWVVGDIWTKLIERPNVHFQLRKDKTVNTEGLTKALDYWATIVLHERQQASIKEQNQATYESLGSPGKDVKYISVELSSSKLNACEVKYSSLGIQFSERLVPLDNLDAVIFAMKQSADNYQRSIYAIFGGNAND